MRKGLLITAFMATLVLDMGAGPVFIVFGSIYLGKPSPFPASVWLMVRGILNCIQFVTVMSMCWIVSHSKSIFSRKEQRILIKRILLTHPIAYFYYLVLLGGVVWNIIGSCWIATAFRYYSSGFAACYLVCVILSWVSSIMSPLFVFFGGLSYSSLRHDPVPSTFHVELIQSQDYSVNDLLQNISESRPLNIPQIMRAGELKSTEPLELPVVSLAMMKSAQSPASPPQEEVMKVELPKPKGNGIVLIDRDYLDTDEPTQQSAWSMAPVVTVVDEKEGEVVQVKVVDDARNSEAQLERGEVEVVRRVEEERERKEEEQERREEKQEKEVTNETEISPTQSERQPKATDELPPHANQKPPAKTPKAKKGRKRKAVNPKDNIVVVETHISAEDAQPIAPNLEPVSQLPFQAESEYVDVSAQMIDDLNTGRFEPATVNKNVFVTYVQ